MRKIWSAFRNAPITTSLILLNTAVFVVMWHRSSSFWLPDEQVLLDFGAKSTAGLLQGEYHRIFTAVIVHIGFLHFVINNFALWVIGKQIERVVGSSFYFLAYWVCGLVGSVGSALLTTGNSAGASGAIFGLVGIGFVFERIAARRFLLETGTKLRRGPFTGLVIVNILLGLILTSGPVRIDNAAHLGGLISGILLGFSFLNIRNCSSRNFLFAYGTVVGLFLFIVVGIIASTSTSLFRYRTDFFLGLPWTSTQRQYEILTEATDALPREGRYLFKRGRLLLLDNQLQLAFEDFNRVDFYETLPLDIRSLVSELDEKARIRDRENLENLFKRKFENNKN